MERCAGVLADTVDLTPEMRERMAHAAGRFTGEYHAVSDFTGFGYIRLDCDRSNPHDGVAVDGRTLAVADDAMTSWRASIHDLYTGWINDLDGEFLDLRPEVEAFLESRLDSLDRSLPRSSATSTTTHGTS